MEDIVCMVADNLEKIFPEKRPEPFNHTGLRILRKERFSFQLAYTTQTASMGFDRTYTLSVRSRAVKRRLFNVDLVPCDLPTNGLDDDSYLKKEPGLYPDLLSENDGTIRPLYGQWRSVWISLYYGEHEKTEEEQIEIAVADKDGTTVFRASVEATLVPAVVENRTIFHTEWLHTDCLASYYNLIPYGQAHWTAIENFISFMKSRSGVNMIYTPLFTPALDTAVGGERLTVQLVEISVTDGTYEFDLSRLARWCAVLKKNGIDYIEICHLFTQWGAHAAPKICATVNGKPCRIFGWDTDATGSAYVSFLRELIPRVLCVLEKNGYGKERVFFHISDEPEQSQLPAYKKACDSVRDLFKGCRTLDALSSYHIYKESGIDIPVVALDHADEFLQNGKSDIWVYYCVAQSRTVPNRFIAQPLYRERIAGILMYYLGVAGFLHWGYNFYFTRYSTRCINPFQSTDAGMHFPSGDPFIVYPGPNFSPLSSIRNETLCDSFTDMALLFTLESFRGRSYVCSLIEQKAGFCPDFRNYPKSKDFIFSLLECVKNEIAQLSGYM